MSVLDNEEWSASRRYHFTAGGKRSWYGVEAGWAPDPVWDAWSYGESQLVSSAFQS